ncbi:MAG: phosphodiester glycosidase family protein [Desulfomonilaceae bacterium]
MEKRVFIFIKIPLLVLIFLIAPNVSPASRIKSLSDHVASVEPQKDNWDPERNLRDCGSIPEWLSLVLNWIPSDNHDLGAAALEQQDQKEKIDEGTTNQKRIELSVSIANVMTLNDIPPLYTSPKIDGEGIWASADTPVSGDGKPLIYKTVYRPSVEFPNTVVYMAVFDMSRLKPRLFIGRSEPGIYKVSNISQQERLSKIVAITNAMWMQQHSRGGGAVVRGKVVYPMVPGMATMVVYQDDSVDVLEWNKDIPLSTVKDARQLSHLILKNGMVVENVLAHGKVTDSEIGLGGQLIDAWGTSTTYRPYWFLANRTAFGVRDDGNLVFVMGHHVSTKDLARALALAGCKRAIHGDANAHNVVCNFYFRDENDKVVKRDKLSPNQLDYTLKRYDRGYTKDYFVFYEK